MSAILVELLNKATPATIVIFVVTTMAGVGMRHSLGQLFVPFRDLRFVLLVLLANFVVVPLGALGLALVLRLDEPLAEGLLLLGAAAGAPVIPSLVALAKGDVAIGTGLMILLTVGTLGYLPLVLPWLLPGVVIDPLIIARPLLLFMLLPLVAGFAVRTLREHVATVIGPAVDRLSNASLFPVVALIVVTNLDRLPHLFGTNGVLAALLLAILGLSLGWRVGGPDAQMRRASAVCTGQRNFAVALVIASESIEDPRVETMVIVAAVVGLLLTLPVVLALAPSRLLVSEGLFARSKA
jgi:BASS family bile acid:Na+ symporter